MLKHEIPGNAPPHCITTTNTTKDTPILWVKAHDTRDWSKPIKMICHPG